jgi:hypothetical protein
MVKRAVFAVMLAGSALAQCAAPEPPGTEAPVASLSEIAGQWDIVSFNDYRPQRLDSDGRRHAFVDIAESGGLSFAIECNYSGMAARIDAAGRLAPASSDDVHVTTAMGCGP